MRKHICKGRDAKGRIKKGYRLTKGGLVRAGAGGRRRRSSTRRRRTNGAAGSLFVTLPSGVRL